MGPITAEDEAYYHGSWGPSLLKLEASAGGGKAVPGQGVGQGREKPVRPEAGTGASVFWAWGKANWRECLIFVAVSGRPAFPGGCR